MKQKNLLLSVFIVFISTLLQFCESKLLCYACSDHAGGCEYSDARLMECVVPGGNAWPRCAYMAAPNTEDLRAVFQDALSAANNNSKATTQEVEKCAQAIKMEMELVIDMELPKKPRYFCGDSTDCARSPITDHILMTVVKACNQMVFYESFSVLSKIDTKMATVCCNIDNCNMPPSEMKKFYCPKPSSANAAHVNILVAICVLFATIHV